MHAPSRRRFVTTLAASAALGCAPAARAAEGWPSRPLTLIVNGGPGSLPDIFARPLAERLRAALGQSVVVENKPGAGGMVAMTQLKQAPPDGHTLALVTNAHLVWNPFVFPRLTYDPVTELQPISPLAVIPMALVVPPRLGVSSLAEFIALAKRRPGELNYASSGNGSPPHVLFEMLRERLGVTLVHVPFKTGTEALTAVAAGDTQVYFAGTALVEPLVKDGRLRVLAVSPQVSAPTFADAPTLQALGYPGYEGAVWLGLAARSGTPAAVIQRLNAEVAQALSDPALKAALLAQGALPDHASPAALAQRIAAERRTWGPAIQRLGIQPS
ncbi:ABC transporter substrate-binding protein [Comamonas serinivorans]|uniref:ABC transporter substrate-binding protein n=1 Tax=Comamonas serinivorans TaxID=1082851 RepID=A0A1Y0EQN1_9BURK|nr:tripartite tricarboxylate transporter substrate binding protein [Comamonas serinivorans]ARU05886.1 ABC transporter substrate-binding protein [Comamonas serinivorans]